MSASTRSIAPGRRPLDAVEHDGGGVGALGAPHEVRPRALGPRLELLGRRGPERVARRPSGTGRPSSRCWRPTLPIVVVLPTPLTPTKSQTLVVPCVEAQRAVEAGQTGLELVPSAPRPSLSGSLMPSSSAVARSSSSSAVGSSTPTSARMSASSSSSQVSVVDAPGADAGEVAGQQAPGLAQPVPEGGLDQRRPALEQLLRPRAARAARSRPAGGRPRPRRASPRRPRLGRRCLGRRRGRERWSAAGSGWPGPARSDRRHGPGPVAAGHGDAAAHQPHGDHHQDEDDDQLHRRVSLSGARPLARAPRRRRTVAAAARRATSAGRWPTATRDAPLPRGSDGPSAGQVGDRWPGRRARSPAAQRASWR